MLADIGTSWAKIADENHNYHILPTRQILHEKWVFSRATGHLGAKLCSFYMNELEALGEGAKKLIPLDDFTVVDVGSRDTKYVRFKGRKAVKLDWNQSCGASTGFTLELLMKYYELKPDVIVTKDSGYFPITCSVFGIERIFDAIINGDQPEHAVGQFVNGIARNVFEFCGKPETLYLSGGLCDNPAFVTALQFYAKVIPLGRFVLLEGLK